MQSPRDIRAAGYNHSAGLPEVRCTAGIALLLIPIHTQTPAQQLQQTDTRIHHAMRSFQSKVAGPNTTWGVSGHSAGGRAAG